MPYSAYLYSNMRTNPAMPVSSRARPSLRLRVFPAQCRASTCTEPSHLAMAVVVVVAQMGAPGVWASMLGVQGVPAVGCAVLAVLLAVHLAGAGDGLV